MACFKGLRFIGVGVLALSALISNGAAAEPSAQPSALAPGLFWLQGQHRAGAQPDGNSVLLKGERGWVLIDSGRHRAGQGHDDLKYEERTHRRSQVLQEWRRMRPCQSAKTNTCLVELTTR